MRPLAAIFSCYSVASSRLLAPFLSRRSMTPIATDLNLSLYLESGPPCVLPAQPSPYNPAVRIYLELGSSAIALVGLYFLNSSPLLDRLLLVPCSVTDFFFTAKPPFSRPPCHITDSALGYTYSVSIKESATGHHCFVRPVNHSPNFYPFNLAPQLFFNHE